MATEQAMAALARANAIRSYRAQIKQNLKRLPRRRSLDACADILYNPLASELATMRATELLAAVHGTGQSRAAIMLRRARVHSQARLGGLSARERAALSEVLLERPAKDAWGNLKPTHCMRGHEFTVENTLVTVNGGRVCRECRSVRAAERYAALVAA